VQVLSLSFAQGLLRPPSETLPEHLGILDALQARDADEAERRMVRHIRRTIDDIRSRAPLQLAAQPVIDELAATVSRRVAVVVRDEAHLIVIAQDRHHKLAARADRAPALRGPRRAVRRHRRRRPRPRRHAGGPGARAGAVVAALTLIGEPGDVGTIDGLAMGLELHRRAPRGGAVGRRLEGREGARWGVEYGLITSVWSIEGVPLDESLRRAGALGIPRVEVFGRGHGDPRHLSPAQLRACVDGVTAAGIEVAAYTALLPGNPGSRDGRVAAANWDYFLRALDAAQAFGVKKVIHMTGEKEPGVGRATRGRARSTSRGAAATRRALAASSCSSSSSRSSRRWCATSRPSTPTGGPWGRRSSSSTSTRATST
jgi:hypothetical protein